MLPSLQCLPHYFSPRMHPPTRRRRCAQSMRPPWFRRRIPWTRQLLLPKRLPRRRRKELPRWPIDNPHFNPARMGKSSANSTVPRLPSVTCGAGAIRVEATDSPATMPITSRLQRFRCHQCRHAHWRDQHWRLRRHSDTVANADRPVLNASGTGSALYTSSR